MAFSYCDPFNQPLDKWQVGKVSMMQERFTGNMAFDQSFAAWTPWAVQAITLSPKMGGVRFEANLTSWAKKKAQLPKWVRVVANGVTFSPERQSVVMC